VSDNYPGGWFGRSWGAPVCDPETHKPTPVGDRCTECLQEIEEDDQGMLIPFAGMTPAVLSSFHLDCFLKTIIPGGMPRSEIDAINTFIPRKEDS
jgi:hypothetical protein